MKLPKWPKMIGYRDIKLRLNRINDLLSRLGDPHLKLPPTIHIAGTNGKGSTLAFIESIFQENGYKVHKYTSPHLVNFNERIKLANFNISDHQLDILCNEVKKFANKKPKIEVTFFEATTVIAFLAFSRFDADILLLETGMGGRLDATNVLSSVMMSIITPISLDHQEFLGESIVEIAKEKAGIIKQKCPIILSKQENDVKETIKQISSNLDSELILVERPRLNIKQQKWQYRYKDIKLEFDLPQMIGFHQIENAATAITACLSQKHFKISHQSINQAITKTKWPARLEPVKSGRFANLLLPNHQLYVDGSHNAAGAETIADFLTNQTKKNQDLKIALIFSILGTKDCRTFLKTINRFVNQLILMEIPNQEKAMKINQLKEVCDSMGLKYNSCINFEEGIGLVKEKYQNNEALILVCGSLYFAGHFIEENY